jgi:uncharacterized protein
MDNQAFLRNLLSQNKQLHLSAKIIAKSSKNDFSIISFSENKPELSLKIKVRAIPEKGKANQAVIEYLSEIFDIKKQQIEIISGLTSNHKMINITA